MSNPAWKEGMVSELIYGVSNPVRMLRAFLVLVLIVAAATWLLRTN